MKHTLKALWASAVILAWLHAGPANCQTISAYSEFQAMPVESLRTLQVKLTYGGASNGKFIPTLLFTSIYSTPTVAPFVPFYRADFGYSSDESIEPSFRAQLSELKTLIDSVGTVAGVTDGGVDPGGLL